jgi:hypothetical protein
MEFTSTSSMDFNNWEEDFEEELPETSTGTNTPVIDPRSLSSMDFSKQDDSFPEILKTACGYYPELEPCLALEAYVMEYHGPGSFWTDPCGDRCT